MQLEFAKIWSQKHEFVFLRKVTLFIVKNPYFQKIKKSKTFLYKMVTFWPKMVKAAKN